MTHTQGQRLAFWKLNPRRTEIEHMNRLTIHHSAPSSPFSADRQSNEIDRDWTVMRADNQGLMLSQSNYSVIRLAEARS